MKGQTSVLLTVIALFVVFFILAKLLGIEMYTKPTKNIGESCKDIRECKGKLACIDGTCQKKRKEGQSCAAKWDCKDGLACSSAGTCQKWFKNI